MSLKVAKDFCGWNIVRGLGWVKILNIQSRDFHMRITVGTQDDLYTCNRHLDK